MRHTLSVDKSGRFIDLRFLAPGVSNEADIDVVAEADRLAVRVAARPALALSRAWPRGLRVRLPAKESLFRPGVYVARWAVDAAARRGNKRQLSQLQAQPVQEMSQNDQEDAPGRHDANVVQAGNCVKRRRIIDAGDEGKHRKRKRCASSDDDDHDGSDDDVDGAGDFDGDDAEAAEDVRDDKSLVVRAKKRSKSSTQSAMRRKRDDLATDADLGLARAIAKQADRTLADKHADVASKASLYAQREERAAKRRAAHVAARAAEKQEALAKPVVAKESARKAKAEAKAVARKRAASGKIRKKVSFAE